MQTKSIKVGEDYAHSTWTSRRNPSMSRVNATHVRVLEKGQKETTSNWRHGYSQSVTHTDRLLVVEIRNGRKYGTPFLAAPRTILAPWTDVEDEKSAVQRQRDDSLRLRNMASKNLSKVVKNDVLPSWATDKVYADGSFSTHGNLSIYTLESIVRAAYERGQSDAADGTCVVFVEA